MSDTIAKKRRMSVSWSARYDLGAVRVIRGMFPRRKANLSGVLCRSCNWFDDAEEIVLAASARAKFRRAGVC